MTMIAGTVAVDDDGNETYTPNNTLNAAKALYQLLIASAATDSLPTSTITPAQVTINGDGSITATDAVVTYVNQPIEITPGVKQTHAKTANLMANWMVTYLKANAVTTIIIPTDSSGDGLQTSQNSGNPTTAPAVAKTLAGTLL